MTRQNEKKKVEQNAGFVFTSQPTLTPLKSNGFSHKIHIISSAVFCMDFENQDFLCAFCSHGKSCSIPARSSRYYYHFSKGFPIMCIDLLPVTYLESSSTAWITVVANVYTTEVQNH